MKKMSAFPSNVIPLFATAVVLLTPSPPLAAQLPPAIQADRFLVQAEREIKDGNYVAAAAALEQIVELQGEHELEMPAAFWFKRAQVAQEAGFFERAIESVIRYLEIDGQEGEHYMEALELLDVAEEEARKAKESEEVEQEAEQRKKRAELVAEEAVREVRELASLGAKALDASGKHFKDCVACPVMVKMPTGQFEMGSDWSGSDNTEPERDVRIATPFAVSKYEITFADWEACAVDGGCDGYQPNDPGWGRNTRPVVSVSWNDAQKYLSWISSKTRQSYRLLSEAEWEYVASAGTRNSINYSWGNDVGRNRANCDGCASYWDDKESAPVGSFPANGFGLHDMHGNVWEWVQDCWKENYLNAPSDGSAWEMEYCSFRSIRGGSFSNSKSAMESVARHRERAISRFNNAGFRIARALR